MIKHFSAFYVGQIELENVGADGPPPGFAPLSERATCREF